MSEATVGKKKSSVIKSVADAVKGVVPVTTGSKIVAGIAVGGVGVGGFVLGRLSKKGKK